MNRVMIIGKGYWVRAKTLTDAALKAEFGVTLRDIVVLVPQGTSYDGMRLSWPAPEGETPEPETSKNDKKTKQIGLLEELVDICTRCKGEGWIDEDALEDECMPTCAPCQGLGWTDPLGETIIARFTK